MTTLKPGFRLIMIAGIAGGIAEVIWIGFYSIMAQSEGLEISRQITATVIPSLTTSAVAPGLGIFIHMVLSILLAAGFCILVANFVIHNFGRIGLVAGSGIALATVWLVNFYILLPVINPSFVTILPLAVSLISKLLFGMAMAAVLLNGTETWLEAKTA